MRKATAALLVPGLVLIVAGVPTAMATHSPIKTAKCTYELGPTEFVEFSTADSVGATSDGWLNWGGCQFEFPDACANCEYSPIEGGPQVSGEYTQVQVSIVDDLFGAGTVGAFACGDVDVNYVCGEDDKGEFEGTFCGTSPVFSHDGDTDGDGHPDLGGRMLVILFGPLSQTQNCDPTAAPTAAIGGILNPAGGIFITLSG